MLVVTITSNALASRTSSAAIASMIRSSYSHLRESAAATARVHSRNSPSDTRSTLALCTAVTFLRRRMASAKAASRDPGRAGARDLAHRQREVRRRHELARAQEHRAVGVEALGVLARDHEIDRRAATRRKAAAAARRPDIGVEIEPLAQLARRIEAALRDRRIVVVRHRPEDHAVGGLGGVDRGVREGRAVRAQRRQADGDGRERQAEAERAVGGAQHRQRGGGDLRPDAVAFHDDEADRRGRRALIACSRIDRAPTLLGLGLPDAAPRQPSKPAAG